MATTQNTFTGNGSTTTFAFTFPYIEESDVKVALDTVDQTTGFSVDTTNIVFDTAPASGVAIRIYRVTNVDQAAATFFSGSAIRAQDLNDNVNQNLYVNQELSNRTAQTTGSTITGDYIFANANIQFEGATDDDHETTLTVTDPTADRTIKLPNQSGTVPVLAADSNTAITATPEELNILDGLTATAAELNTMDGITATTAELNIMDGVTATTAELNLMDGVTATTGELNILDGVTATTAELNLMDGVTATTAELNHVDGVTSAIQTQLDAKQPLDAELTELATMGSNTAAALADLTQAEVQILDGATLSTAELNFVDGVTSDIQTQIDGKQAADAELTELATMGSTTASALADLTQAEVEVLDGATVTTAELNILDGVTASTAELNLLDGVTATTAELNILDGVTATFTELNQLDGNTLKTTSTDFTSSSQFPSASEIDSRITARIDPIDGFVAIADEDSFPTTTPPVGTAVSISNAGGMVIGASASTTDASRAGGSDTVTIQNIPANMQSQTIQDGIGMIVIATSTSHTYDFHRVIATNADVIALSDDINDFNNRYRVGSTNPTVDNDEGDLFYNTGSDKMLVYDGSSWEEVQSIGEYFIIPDSDFPTWNGTLNDISITSNAPANAEQIILSINGVIQEPNSGTARPTDGFSLNGSTIQLAAAPATGSEAWGVIIGSTVNIGTPSAGTVTNTQVSASAAIAGTKISPNFGSQDIVTTGDVGIGTTSPAKALHIDSGSDQIRLSDGTGGFELRAGNSFKISDDGTERMQIDSNGRVKIGNDSNYSAATGSKLAVELMGTAGTILEIADQTAGFSTFESVKNAGGGATDYGGYILAGRRDADDDIKEYMRIDSSGNVGIGTSAPGYRLDVGNGTSHNALRVNGNANSLINITASTTGNARLEFGDSNDDDAGKIYYSNSDNAFTFATNGGAEDMRIDSSGNLQVSTGQFTVGTTASTGLQFINDGTFGTLHSANLVFRTVSTERMRIDNSGRLLINNTTSNQDHPLQVTASASSAHAIAINARASDDIGELTFFSNNRITRQGEIQYRNDQVNIRHRSGSIRFATGGTTERMRIDGSGRLLVGTTTNFDSSANIQAQGNGLALKRDITDSGVNNGLISFYSGGGLTAYIYGLNDGVQSTGDTPGALVFATTADGASSPTVRMRIANNGDTFFTKTSNVFNTPGFRIAASGLIEATVNAGGCLNLNRMSDDGGLVGFYQNGVAEGNIDVNGTTVAYNGAHLSRWSQLAGGAERIEILRGSVLSNLDEMCEWGEEDNEQLNRMKVSDVEGDRNVSGVFQSWDDDDDTYTNDFYCAMTGDFVIRIAQGTTVARGDLLMSAGDGTAKPQDDDIVRSKTVAKVTSTTVSTTYDDGSYCVPCVLMAC